jgi:hypothetical protein
MSATLEVRRVQLWALGIGAVAIIAAVVGALFDPVQFCSAYLVAFLYYLSIAHGCFVVLMIYHLTGGGWGFLIRRPLEAGMATLPLLALYFVVLAWGAGYLYPWAQPDEVAARPALQQRAVYLNLAFFCVRAAIAFTVWLVLAYFLARWSRLQDETGDAVYARQLELLSGPGLVVYGITIMFAAVDWLMSLQPAVHSSIIGPLFASGELLVGFASALLVFAWLTARLSRAAVAEEAVGDLGNLLFTFVILWAYMEYFQFMLVWIANLPYEAIWYLPRTEGGWLWVSWGLALVHFAVPFFLLLSRDLVRSPRALAGLAVVILVAHLVYLNQLVVPVFSAPGWLDVVMPFALGGPWLALYLWNLQQSPLLPRHDANEAAALHQAEAPLSTEVSHG